MFTGKIGCRSDVWVIPNLIGCQTWIISKNLNWNVVRKSLRISP